MILTHFLLFLIETMYRLNYILGLLIILSKYASASLSSPPGVVIPSDPSLNHDGHTHETCADHPTICDPHVDEIVKKDLNIIWDNIVNQDKILNSPNDTTANREDVTTTGNDPSSSIIISSKIIDYSRPRNGGESTADLYASPQPFTVGSNIDMITKIFHQLFLHPRSEEYNIELKNKSRSGIIERLSHYTLETQVQEFFAKAPNGSIIPGVNIFGVIPSSRRGQPGDEIVLIGAHYDTDGSTPGADDNGSGVIGMLEVARILSPKMGILNKTIMFVAFDHEEKGILGSLAFVNNYLIPHELKAKRSRFTGAYIMEMILNYDPTPNSQILPLDIIAVSINSDWPTSPSPYASWIMISPQLQNVHFIVKS